MACQLSRSRRKVQPQALRRRGMSLLTLVLLLAVLAIALALLLPAIGMARAQARTTRCANNQRQISVAWMQASARLGAPIAPGQWQQKIRPFLEGEDKVFACPDNIVAAPVASYGMNTRAFRMADRDPGRIVLLDYGDVDVKVVGQTIAQLNQSWPALAAARHFQKQNVAFMDGHIELKSPAEIDPRFCDYFARYWRPASDANIELSGCLALGAPLGPGHTGTTREASQSSRVP